MGQYQQWLHYREIDQSLQVQIETLEHEVAHLQERARVLEQSVQPQCENVVPLLADNQIMRVLLLITNTQPATNGQTPAQRTNPQSLPPIPSEAEKNETTESISTALFAWTSLPNFGPPAVPDEPQRSPNGSAPQFTEVHRSAPPISHADMALLPEDMGSFIDQHAQTDPQLELPHWLRHIAAATQHPDGPVDQESIRTNRLVQRWIERWGRQVEHPQQPGEGQP